MYTCAVELKFTFGSCSAGNNYISGNNYIPDVMKFSNSNWINVFSCQRYDCL